MRPLNPLLYSETECLAAAGLLPDDHPAWKVAEVSFACNNPTAQQAVLKDAGVDLTRRIRMRASVPNGPGTA